MVKIKMPKKLMHTVDRGYTNLDKNKVQDIINQTGINSQIDPADQLAQGQGNEQPE